MPKKINNKEFETHIKKLIIDKDLYRMLEQLRSILRKIVFILGDEDWVKNDFSNYQKKNSMKFLLDYTFICCINELTTVLNDSGTLAPGAGVKKWKGEYEEQFFEYLSKIKELKSNKQNLKKEDMKNFVQSLNKLLTFKNQNDIEKEIMKISGKWGLERRDLVSIRGFTFELEDRIIGAIWDEEE